MYKPLVETYDLPSSFRGDQGAVKRGLDTTHAQYEKALTPAVKAKKAPLPNEVICYGEEEGKYLVCEFPDAAKLLDARKGTEVLTAAGFDWDDDEVNEQLEIELKYAGYIDRQTAEIARVEKEGERMIPEDLDYADIRGLSNEVVQKLQDSRPETVAQAGRIPGVTPAAVSLLLIALKKRSGERARATAQQAGGGA